ncbi:MAG: hypothetical protein H7124_05130 [Phycisphaerales bacterium]|nr:hypothetical protein [Hyphomonadaceae bacterium]
MADGGNTFLDWVKGLGLPVASLVASAAFFGIQMQQQAFERKLNNIENGYRSYFERRTSLEKAADVTTETTLLQLLGSAFPNVYCNVRADMYARATTAEGGGTGEDAFTEADRTYLISFLVANRTPPRGEFRTDFGSLLRSQQEAAPQPCTAEFDTERGVVAPATEPQAAPEDQVAENAPSASAPSATTELPAAADTPQIDPAVRARIGVRADAAREIVERAYAPRAQTYQVFFHIREGSGRTRESLDPLRAPLAGANFRVMRGVQEIATASFPRGPRVRYFGPDQEAAANELVATLNAHYQSEGLTFRADAIGTQYPNMPPTHLEVWVP